MRAASAGFERTITLSGHRRYRIFRIMPCVGFNSFTFRALYIDYVFMCVASAAMWTFTWFHFESSFNDGLVYYALMFICGMHGMLVTPYKQKKIVEHEETVASNKFKRMFSSAAHVVVIYGCSLATLHGVRHAKPKEYLISMVCSAVFWTGHALFQQWLFTRAKHMSEHQPESKERLASDEFVSSYGTVTENNSVAEPTA